MSNSYRLELFDEAGRQVVRLPEECRFEGPEVVAHREGRKVILEPAGKARETSADPWPEPFLEALGSIDQPLERPPGAAAPRDSPSAGPTQ